MFSWVDAMPLLEKIYFYIALPASLFMVIQTVMLFIGGAADSGLDPDTSGMGADIPDHSGGAEHHDGHAVGDHGLRFLTMRGIIIFLTVFGWTGICFYEMGAGGPVSMTFAVVFGVGAMIGVAFLARGLLGLQSVGGIDYREALGQYADVYLPIPPKGGGYGKINLTLRGALSQYDAATDDEAVIKTGELVRVTDIMHGSVLVVERENSRQGG